MRIHKPKFNTRTNTRTKVIAANGLGKWLFYILFSLFLLSAISYMYFVGKTTFNIVERRNTEREISVISSRIGELELEYLSLNDTVDLELARTLGFHESSNTYFALRKTLVIVSD